MYRALTRLVKKIFYESLDGTRLCGVIQEPKATSHRGVILAHGLASDKDEGGIFIDLAEALSTQGFRVLRFDFRGHGESGGKDKEMTITGEFIDMVASYRLIHSMDQASTLSLLAASFGAGPTIMFASVYQTRPSSIVLWNPVLDYEKTFLRPKSAWAKQFFNEKGYEQLTLKGYLSLGDFAIGSTLIDEMESIRPFRLMNQIICPVLSLHGNQDSKVPFEVTQANALCNSQSRFITVEGGDHGFPAPKDAKFAIRKSAEWLSNQDATK